MADLTVPYAHCWDEMRKGIDSQGPYYTVRYYISDWSVSDLVANELRGYTQRTGSTTIRTGPHQHPLSTNLCCVDVEIEGCGNMVRNPQGYPSYDAGFFAHATYRAIPFMPYTTDDPYGNNQLDPTNPILWCSQEIDFEDEVYVLEKNQLVWESDLTPSQIPVKITVNITTMNLTFYQLPYLPITTIRSVRNCVNTVAVLGVAIGKLWFKGCRTQRDLNTDGTMMQTLHMQFKERDIEWNKFIRLDGTWDYLKNPGGARVLPAADLTPLLQI